MPLEPMKKVNPRNLSLIPYYGGKFTISKRIGKIIECIDPVVYCEPYAGGASVLLNLPRDSNRVDVINDLNSFMYIFYKTVKLYPVSLKKRLDGLLYSFQDYENSRILINTRYIDIHNISKREMLDVSVAVYISVCSTIGGSLGGNGWTIGKVYGANRALRFRNKIRHFDHLINVFDDVHLDCIEAEKCIKRWDSKKTLFYIDPPYVNAYHSHYGRKDRPYSTPKFGEKEWEDLCKLLEIIKGQYMLSNYSNDIEPSNHNIRIEIPVSKKNNLGSKGSEDLEIIWCKVNDPDKVMETIKHLGLTVSPQ